MGLSGLLSQQPEKINGPTRAAAFAGPAGPEGTSAMTDGLTSSADTTGAASMSEGENCIPLPSSWHPSASGPDGRHLSAPPRVIDVSWQHESLI